MNFAERYKADIVSAVESIDLQKISDIIELFKEARSKDRKILVCGNSRSAAAAARVLCDMVMRSTFERAIRFRILPLDDITRQSDAEREGVFPDRLLLEELKNFAEPGDIVVGISAVDNSAPLLRALEYAARIGCKNIVLTGADGGKLAVDADVAIRVDSTNLSPVEDSHLIICHMIGTYFMEFDRPCLGSGSNCKADRC
jgi:D-sedoheptulose 7-phosphate isomerase